jgi:hypothetical protein
LIVLSNLFCEPFVPHSDLLITGLPALHFLNFPGLTDLPEVHAVLPIAAGVYLLPHLLVGKLQAGSL